MWVSSAISRRAWRIHEQRFSDWAACIWISAGVKIWGALLTRKIELVSSYISSFWGVFVPFSTPRDLFPLASFSAVHFLEFLSFSPSFPQSQFLSLPLFSSIYLFVSSCLSLLCFYWHMDQLSLLPKSCFGPPDNTRCYHPDRQQKAGERQAYVNVREFWE